MDTAKSVEWETPQALFDELDREFGFTLDVCATKENAKCEKYFTKEQDGLSQNWGGAQSLVQSALWQRDSRLGKESCTKQYACSNALAVKNRC